MLCIKGDKSGDDDDDKEPIKVVMSPHYLPAIVLLPSKPHTYCLNAI